MKLLLRADPAQLRSSDTLAPPCDVKFSFELEDMTFFFVFVSQMKIASCHLV